MADAPLSELGATYGAFQLLASGPLGETWKARDKTTGSDVVIKIRARSKIAVAYFTREIDLMQRLVHPGLQRFLQQLSTDEHFVAVYEFVPGTSLKDHVQFGAMPFAQVIAIINQVLGALQTVHDAGFIYRDVSPQNIILRGPHDPVLIDFNAVGELTETSRHEQTTILGEVTGKPLYMSPEQLTGAPQTPKSDIWGVGALLYEMLTGRTYRTGATLADIITQSLSADPPDVTAAPARMQALLARLLATDPDLRPTMREVREKVAQIGDPFAPDMDNVVLPPLPVAAKSRAADDSYPAVPMAAPVSKSAKAGTVFWIVLALLGLAGGFAALILNDFDVSGLADSLPGPAVLTAVGFIGLAVAFVILGQYLSYRVQDRASDVRAGLPFQAVDLISGPDARDVLSRTICLEIDAYRAAAAGSGDDILTITMVAVAQEYRDAESTDDRIKALQMLADLNAKVSAKLKPWWLDYETLVARGISLTGLLAGAVALFQAFFALV